MTPYKWLLEKNITIEQFAERIGVSRSQAHRYLNEGAVPRPKIMLKIFDLTNGDVTPNDFHNISTKVEITGDLEFKIVFVRNKNEKK